MYKNKIKIKKSAAVFTLTLLFMFCMPLTAFGLSLSFDSLEKSITASLKGLSDFLNKGKITTENNVLPAPKITDVTPSGGVRGCFF